MYPQPDKDEKRADVSQDNAREIVEQIDRIIVLRCLMAVKGPMAGVPEEIEVAKRKITDYLLVTDPRAGVFVDKVYGKT